MKVWGRQFVTTRRKLYPLEWYIELFEHAKAELTIFSTFDFSAIELLEKLNAPAYKIASFERVDLPLIRAAASTGKPLIISTGMANEVKLTMKLKLH